MAQEIKVIDSGPEHWTHKALAHHDDSPSGSVSKALGHLEGAGVDPVKTFTNSIRECPHRTCRYPRETGRRIFPEGASQGTAHR